MADTGIAPEVLPRVFDPFFQAERTHKHPQGGLGFGLTLVKRLVEMPGGTVEAHSEGLGRGSEFVVRLPVAAPADEAPVGADGAPPGGTPGCGCWWWTTTWTRPTAWRWSCGRGGTTCGRPTTARPPCGNRHDEGKGLSRDVGG